MIVIKYNRTEKTTKDIAIVDEQKMPLIAQKVIHADTYIFEGAIFAVISRKYDIDSDQLIIYVQ